MREIKFRGRDCTGEWWYGNLEIKRKNTDEKTYESYRIIGITTDHSTSGIDVNTIGQFTGLRDSNGVEIYEGDVIKYYKKELIVVINEVWIWGVRLKTINPPFGDSFLHDTRDILCDTEHIEVIGNIHDKEKAKRYVESRYPKCSESDAFLAGVNYAQKWIPANEKLPVQSKAGEMFLIKGEIEDDSKVYVISKNKKVEFISLGVYNHHCKEWHYINEFSENEKSKIKVKYWRKIDLNDINN